MNWSKEQGTLLTQRAKEGQASGLDPSRDSSSLSLPCPQTCPLLGLADSPHGCKMALTASLLTNIYPEEKEFLQVALG